MAVREFDIVGPLADREAFRSYLYGKLLAREALQIEIKERNELAVKRGDGTKMIAFNVNEIHREVQLINGRTDDGAFIQVEVGDILTVTLIDD